MQLSWRMISFSLFTLVVFAGLVKLGLWQTERGAQKQALLDTLQAQSNQAPADLFAILNTPLPQRHGMPVKLKVTLDAGRSVLLDNKTFEGKVGYQLLVPAQHQDRHLLVHVGWLPATPDRNEWPAIPQLPTTVWLTGHIKLPSRVPVLNDALIIERKGAVVRSQTEAPAILSEALQLPLEPWLVRLDEQAEWGLPRQWQWLSMGPEKHYGYALQWYSLALAIFILLLLF
ncbi:SURF1 family protein [Neiella marina]|uniref:SURF1-like protein n=1 Tax=Neiella holothuriorum TaxID=2870530 RepID=A0ABS7EFW4_9GAMM|nr:SURF1 family protein [Neiella holothuriorum]MBW8191238.1 SURF1 family protein [Neiella holothuriorum]